MLPEIEHIRTSSMPVSPEQLKHLFPERATAIDMAIKRALSAGTIKRISTGLYAHPKYESPIDRGQRAPIKESEPDWKNGTHASLTILILNGMIKDYDKPNPTYWHDCILPIFRLMAETLDDESIKYFATNLVKACRSKEVRDRIASDYSAASVADWTERIRQEKS